jgi:hypothetical protein
MIRLFSYKMTDDTGFAPNPFWGMLTLATCKPEIRRTKREEDWIAGFTSKALCGDPVGQEKLIYLMEITKKEQLRYYFTSQDFRDKKPLDGCHHVCKIGDNIYQPLCVNASASEDFKRLPEALYHCTESNKQKDLGGGFVLISTKFFYFGGEALRIPDKVRPELPTGQSAHGSRTRDETRARDFINYVSQRGIGIHGAPHRWPSGDSSWNMKCRELTPCPRKARQAEDSSPR